MAFLTLEDGTVFEGVSFGADRDATGEVVFNTGVVGYQDILTDPAYSGQIVVMTYPLIGNYGINSADTEGVEIRPAGFIVREYCETPSNWRCEKSLGDYLAESGMVALCGIDTRAITKHIREKGTMRGVITMDAPAKDFVFEAKDEVPAVTCKEPYVLCEGDYRVAVLDLGMNKNHMKLLQNCELCVFPADTNASIIIDGGYEGVVISGGPGNPKNCTKAIETVKEMMGKLPMFGVGLGHQVMALAAGADTEKLLFGHRGANHPVKNLETGRTFITAQNHGYIVTKDSVPECAEVTHVSMNDGTVEGICYKDMKAFSVQYEADVVPGPSGREMVLDKFIRMMEEVR